MKTKSFEQAADDWLSGKRSLWGKISRPVKSLYFNKAPQRLRFFGFLHWGAKTGLAASPPVFAWYYGTIQTVGVVLIATAAIAGLHSVVGLLDALSKEKSSSTSDNQSDVIVRFGDLLAAHRQKGNLAVDAKDDAIRACLGILEIFTRQTTKSKKGDVSVSVVLYQGSSKSNLNIRHRNPGNERPTGRDIKADGLLGHRVCEYGELPQVLDDVRELGKRKVSSPTQSKMEYRSIFFYPLEIDGKEGKFIKGFISIDCKKPYAFYGNRSNDIVVTCEPVLNHIKELIQEPQNARKPQKT